MDNRSPHPHPERFEVELDYNGMHKPLQVRLTELTSEVLQQAIRLFGIVSGAHVLALFTSANAEVPEGQATVASAGIHPFEHLTLRPSAVKAG